MQSPWGSSEIEGRSAADDRMRTTREGRSSLGQFIERSTSAPPLSEHTPMKYSKATTSSPAQGDHDALVGNVSEPLGYLFVLMLISAHPPFL
jgi:hypothetical protein